MKTTQGWRGGLAPRDLAKLCLAKLCLAKPGVARCGLAVLAVAVLLFATLASGVSAQNAKKNEAFYDVSELRRLLEVARESGFSEQELREIAIEDNGEFIKAARKVGFSEKELRLMTVLGDERKLNVWGYLQVLETRKKLAAENLKAQQSKIYLTVQDLLAEMKKKNPDDLTKLRDKLPAQ